MSDEEIFVVESEPTESHMDINAGYRSLDEESLAGGCRKGEEQEVEELDGTLRGYRSEDESMARGYYTSSYEKQGEGKNNDGSINIQRSQLSMEGIPKGFTRSASPETLERAREFAWQQFLAREKQKEELYKQFEAGKLEATLFDGTIETKERDVAWQQFLVQEKRKEQLFQQFEAGKLKAKLSQGGSNDSQSPKETETNIDGKKEEKDKNQSLPRNNSQACPTSSTDPSMGILKEKDEIYPTNKRMKLNSKNTTKTWPGNFNKIKNQYPATKTTTYRESPPPPVKTNSQDSKRPVPSVADIEAMITSVKDDVDISLDQKTVTGFPRQREAVFDGMKHQTSIHNKDKLPRMLTKCLPSVPSAMQRHPIPTFPPRLTYSIVPNLPIPTPVPTYPARPLPLAPPDLTRPPPRLVFNPSISTPTPSNICYPPPPSAFPVPILSRPPPITDFNGNSHNYPCPPLTSPLSRELISPETSQIKGREERGSTIKKSDSGRRQKVRSNSCDRNRSFERRKSSVQNRSSVKSNSCDRRTRSRSKDGGRERRSQGKNKQNYEKSGNNKSTSRNQLESRSSSLSPEDVLSCTDPGKVGKGTKAIVKEYIDEETGILEVFKGPGQQGPIVLFHTNQLWILDRKVDSHGDPVRYIDIKHGSNIGVKDIVPVGQLVMANIRSVRSQFVDFQATVIWPSYSKQPPYTVKPSDLNEQLTAFHASCSLDTFLPLCIEGLPAQDPTSMCNAVIKEVIDQNWGLIEINHTATRKEENGDLTKNKKRSKYLCLFHQSDVWLIDGLHTAKHDFFVDKPLADIVAIDQPVNVTARSITKANQMDDSSDGECQMQALCVSLQPDLIPIGAGTGTKLLGGPGTIGGINVGQTPYMFETGLDKKLNKKLVKFIEETRRKSENIDGRFFDVGVIVKEEIVEIVENNNNIVEGNKKIHKITDIEEMARLYKEKTGAKISSANMEICLSEKMSNSIGMVREYLDENTGVLESLHKNWLCLFTSSCCVLKLGYTMQQSYPVKSIVQINANLIDKNKNIQYLASKVWDKTVLTVVPNIIEKNMISQSNLSQYHQVNKVMENDKTWMEQLDAKEGVVIRILDDNFGIIQHQGHSILFDTCDLWISSQFTAAKKIQKLQSVIKVGVKVIFHAALIEKSVPIPYIASAVWPLEATFFKDSSTFPAAIRKESIHSDKIKIYRMVSKTIKEPLPDITSIKEEKKNKEKVDDSWQHNTAKKAPQFVNQHIHAFEGIVKIGFQLKNKPGLFCGIIEFIGQDLKDEPTTNKRYYAFFLSKNALEDHEKSHISVPKTRVFFNASQFKNLGPVSYLVTTISKLHKILPHEVISRTTDTVEEVMKTLENILANNLPEISTIESAPYQIITIDRIQELINPSLIQDTVIDCRDGCRLVCMLNKDSGVLEDSSRNLCYFERSDLNLETELGLHDIVVLFTRINLIRIRFQATEVQEVAHLGPIKLVAHDKSVKISGNIGDRLPNVKKCASNYGKNNGEANCFSNDKVARAREAAIMFKLGKYLKPEFIFESPDFKPQFDVGKRKDEGKSRKRKLTGTGNKSRETIKFDRSKRRKRSRSEQRVTSSSRSKERFSNSPQRIVRTSRKDGTFETQSQPRKLERSVYERKEKSVKKQQLRRHFSEHASNKRIEMKNLNSFEGSNQTLRSKQPLSSCKIIERYKGKVRTILNENFGLIEFHLDLKYPAFCLFDTFDLLVEDDETAAQGKLTVGNVVSLDMEVSFNACELQPGKAVPWLATAVWRTDGPVLKFPPVVEPQNIQQDKVEVYKKMAETCEVLVFKLLKPVGATDTVDKEEEVVLERGATNLLQLEKRKMARRRPKNDEVETNPKFLEERRRDIEGVKDRKAYRTYSRECPRDKRESRDPFTPDRFMIQSKTNWEESVNEWKLEIHAWYKEQSKEYNQNRKRHLRDEDIDGQGNKKLRRSRSPQRSASGHLPSKIYDHVTSGTVDHIVSELYVVVRLSEPTGAKAILHYDRVWVDDHQIFGGWRVLNYGWFQDLRINARRIHVDNLDIDYQVTFAHVGIRSYDPKRGVYNYTGRMNKFVEERMDSREMDRELDKCLDLIRK